MSFVLLVEDDESISETVTELLEEEGHTAVRASDGRAALEILARRERPCLILLDLMMPGLDGTAVLDAIHADQRLAAVPVIITSASSQIDQVASGWANEVRAVLKKPFEIEQLLTAVGHYCPGHISEAARPS